MNTFSREYVIEQAREEDLEAIIAVLQTANMHHVPSPEMPELDCACFFVARRQGGVIGAAGYKVISPAEGKTTLMAVLPEYRRYGIGRALQEERMLALARRGIVRLTTNADIPETIAWYKKHFGYREVGKLPKIHPFGRPDVQEWTTLETDLQAWMRRREQPSSAENSFGTVDPFPLRPYSNLIINAALTGMVPRKRHTPHVPVSVEEIIEQGVRCVRAGASILHLHARDPEENPTWKASVYARIIEGIRKECPLAILCVTTSGREHNEFEKRSEVLELDGSAKPDMASLTLGSLNFPDKPSINTPEMIMKLASRMQEKGIKQELEIFDTGMINTAKYLCRKGLLSPPHYFNILLGSIYSTQAGMTDLTYLVQLLPPNELWAGGGIGIFQLVVNVASIVMGGHVRVGIEDNIWFDYAKTRLATNEEMILRIRGIAREFGRELATPLEARTRLGLEMPKS